jgi:hypothetical protein
MSKAIPLKLKEDVFKETENIRNYLNITRNAYITAAIQGFNATHQQTILKEKLKKESLLVQKESMKVLNEYEAIEHDISAKY